jgi:hypothetical protein
MILSDTCGRTVAVGDTVFTLSGIIHLVHTPGRGWGTRRGPRPLANAFRNTGSYAGLTFCCLISVNFRIIVHSEVAHGFADHSRRRPSFQYWAPHAFPPLAVKPRSRRLGRLFAPSAAQWKQRHFRSTERAGEHYGEREDNLSTGG